MRVQKEEIEKTLNKTNPGKSPGPDQIHPNGPVDGDD